MKSDDLTREEWSYLHRLVLSAGAIFAPGGAEREVYTKVILRTIWFHKVEESLLVPSFKRGDLRVAWFPSSFPPRTLRRALDALARNHVLCMWRTGRTSSEWRIRIEIASIMIRLTQLFPEQGMLVNLREKILSAWSRTDWEIHDIKIAKELETMAGMDVTVPAARKKSEESMARIKAKRAARPIDGLTGRWVPAYMKDVCNRLGIRYADPLPSTKDRAQQIGSADNFLKYCKDSGIDPRRFLEDLCEHWERMRSEGFIAENGKQVHVSSVVSFLEFFRHRREIVLWLERNKDELPRYEVEIT